MVQHTRNFVAICLTLITKIKQRSDKKINSSYTGEFLGIIPNIHDYIRNRALMSTQDFKKHLRENYNWWMLWYYDKEDKNFFNFFTRGLMHEIMKLEEEWANPKNVLEDTITKIVSFFKRHPFCNSPKQHFLILLYCISSKCFYFNRKSMGKKHNQRKYVYLFEYLKDHEKNIRIQTLFLKILVILLNANPNLYQEIQNLGPNDSNMLDSVVSGFNFLKKLFLKRLIPQDIVPFYCQQQILESTIHNLLFNQNPDVKDYLAGIYVLRKFYPTQMIHPMQPRFRHFLIGRSYMTMLLIWRMFHRDKLNNLKRISNSIVTKLMMTTGFFPQTPDKPFIKSFLCLPLKPFS
jgi:hypothetical protein